MLLNMLNINFNSIMPEILTTGLALAVLVLDLVMRKGSGREILGWVSILGLIVIFPVALFLTETHPSFGGTVFSDGYAAMFKGIFIIAAILTILLSFNYSKKMGMNKGEYYHIILFATVGMMVMAAANDLITLYVGLELMALSLYILVAMRFDSNRSVEAAMKYFVLGALSSGILLYGMSFIYGAAGTTNITQIAAHLGRAGVNSYMTIGIVLMSAGFAFKVAAFPFHVWAPDVYEGAPTPVTALLSVGSKAAAFAAFIRVFIAALPSLHGQWSSLLWVAAALTMVFGSVVAISQKNIIRMLAYSSIAHAGVIIVGLVAFNLTGIAGIIFYLLIYTFMNMGAFAVVMLLAKKDGTGENIDDYKGLATERPLMAFFMALFLLSLAGVPPTGGFTAKFFVLASAVEAHYYWLAAIGVISTAISLFFYAKIIFYMYMKPPKPDSERAPAPGVIYTIVLFIAAAGTVFFGVYPTPVLDMALNAVRPFFM